MDGFDTDTHLCLVCNEKIDGLMNYVTHKQKKCSPRAEVQTSNQEFNATSTHNQILSVPNISRSKIISGYSNTTSMGYESDLTIDIQPLMTSDVTALPRTLSETEPISDIGLQTLPVTSSSQEPISYNLFTNSNQSVPVSQSLNTCPSQSDVQDTTLSLDFNQLNSFMNEEFPTPQSLGSNQVTSPSTDSFFQSLELQSRKSPNKTKSGGSNEARNIYSNLESLSITNFLNNLDFSSDEDLTNFPSDDELNDYDDESYVPSKPPRSHTGGKWKPGEHPGYKSRRTSTGKKMPGGKWKPGMLNKSTKEDKKPKTKACNKIYECRPCKLTFTSPYNYSSHCRQKTHKQNIQDACQNLTEITTNANLNVSSDQTAVVPRSVQADTETEASPLPISHTESELKTRSVRARKRKPTTKADDNQQETTSNQPKDEKQLNNEKISDEKHVCTICDKKFTRKYEMVQHLMTRFHKNRAVGHSQELEILAKYERYVVKLSAYQCAICQFYFNHHSDLLSHVTTSEHTQKCEDTIGDLTCLLCNCSCENALDLKNHMTGIDHLGEVKKTKNSKICVIKDVVDLKCKFCGLKQASFTRLKKHIAARHKDGTVTTPVLRSKTPNHPKCLHCDHVAAYPSALALHMKRIHSTERPYNCTPCKKGFVDKYSYDKHLVTPLHNRKAIMIGNGDKVFVSWKQKSEETDDIWITKSEPKVKRQFKCESCDFKTYRYEELRVHCTKEHEDEVTICKMCDVFFLSVKAYRVHCSGKTHQGKLAQCGELDGSIEGEKEKVVECPKCSKMFSDEKWMNLHIEFNHNHISSEDQLLQINGNTSKVTELYGDHLQQIENMPADASVSCPECGKFVNHERIVEHLRLHTNERPFNCKICNRGFIGRLSLRRHLMVHVGLTENTCNICNREFKRYNSYKTHMDRHKSKEEHECIECGQKFPLLKQLQHHLKRHGERSFKCTYKGCTWSFVLRNELKIHLITHTGEKSYLCDACGFAAATKSRLQRHTRIHTGERDYCCEYCTYKAGNRTHLRRHMRIHIGAKPFQCPYCAYNCNTHENIRKHILKTKKHEGMPVYPCKLCDFGSNSSQDFRSHLITGHSDQVKLDGLDKLAEYSGLYVREADPKKPVEGTQILPLKERHKQIKTQKQVRFEQATSLFSQPTKSEIETEPSPEKKPRICTVSEQTTQLTDGNVSVQWQESAVSTSDMRIDWDQSSIPSVAYHTEVRDDKSSEDFTVLQASNIPVSYDLKNIQHQNFQNLSNYYQIIVNDAQYQQQQQ